MCFFFRICWNLKGWFFECLKIPCSMEPESKKNPFSDISTLAAGQYFSRSIDNPPISDNRFGLTCLTKVETSKRQRQPNTWSKFLFIASHSFALSSADMIKAATENMPSIRLPYVNTTHVGWHTSSSYFNKAKTTLHSQHQNQRTPRSNQLPIVDTSTEVTLRVHPPPARPFVELPPALLAAWMTVLCKPSEQERYKTITKQHVISSQPLRWH